MNSGWILMFLLPVLFGDKTEIKAVVLPSEKQCKIARDDLKFAGAKIVKDCAFSDGTVTFVINTEDDNG